MATFDFTIKGTIYDAPDEQQALNFLRMRLARGPQPMGAERVQFDSVSDAELEVVQ